MVSTDLVAALKIALLGFELIRANSSEPVVKIIATDHRNACQAALRAAGEG